MAEVQLRFLREGITWSVERGTTILAAEVAAGLQPDAPCGGQGSCGKCLVDIRRPGETRWQRVKACQTPAEEDLEVMSIPRDQGMRVLDEGTSGARIPWHPWVEVLPLQVRSCPAGESSSDWSRLAEALAAASGRERWGMELPLASRLGQLLRDTGGSIWAVVDEERILDLWPEKRRVYMAAFDVGTTSIAGYLLSGDGPDVAAKAGMLNPQAQYGADVIMRANYALNQGADKLADCVREGVDRLLGELCGQAGVSREEVLAVSVVGNTCMHHLFLGITPESLVKAPYNPAVNEKITLRAADYGIRIHPAGRLLMLPVIAGFVGADTVGCLLSGGWDHLEELSLMIDIGTNGEIVMGDRRRMIACSTAAGPAFEGAKIQCGMRGAQGAVEHVTLENGRVTWQVIGGGPAKGICGSGLIDLVAVLRRTGTIDESGKLTCGDQYRLGDTDVVLTQRDVREVQLAKGAISAGIRLLAERLGISLEEICRVDIAGAFGNYMSPDSACDIGLIPQELRAKIRPVGNAAGEGAKLVLQNREAWHRAGVLAEQAEFLELASLPQFQDEFVDALEFPELEGVCYAGV